MEALHPDELAQRANAERQLPKVASGYLAQPDMRRFIEEALGLGWRLQDCHRPLSSSMTMSLSPGLMVNSSGVVLKLRYF